MADKKQRVPGNEPGRFYVDQECIDCDLCREIASDNFDRNEDEGFSYVYKQPETEAELKACREALDSCPVEAIGSDGEETADEEPGTQTGAEATGTDA
jgi:ferredoxin